MYHTIMIPCAEAHTRRFPLIKPKGPCCELHGLGSPPALAVSYARCVSWSPVWGVFLKPNQLFVVRQLFTLYFLTNLLVVHRYSKYEVYDKNDDTNRVNRLRLLALAMCLVLVNRVPGTLFSKVTMRSNVAAAWAPGLRLRTVSSCMLTLSQKECFPESVVGPDPPKAEKA